MAKYSKKAGKSVKNAMHRRKKGTLKSGSGKKVTSRKQAIAIGLSEARKKGAKVPTHRAKKAAKPSRRSTRSKSTKTSYAENLCFLQFLSRKGIFLHCSHIDPIDFLRRTVILKRISRRDEMSSFIDFYSAVHFLYG